MQPRTAMAFISPTLAWEQALQRAGHRWVAGVDEAGRGPLAGPVVAAAVVLPGGAQPAWTEHVRESKQLTPGQRARFCEQISRGAAAVGVGIVPSDLIDTWGIGKATRQAMGSAVEQLAFPPDFVLVDGREVIPLLSLPQKALVKGDVHCLSIACASVVAKVTRDAIMEELDRAYPGYDFARHKGYATPQHLHLLRTLGPCAVHRRSFAPVRVAQERNRGEESIGISPT